MQLNEALTFLKNHQPMSDHPDEEELTRFRATTLFFYNNPDKRCIPLLLGAAGLFEDVTLYDSIQSVLENFSHEEVVGHVADACRSPYPSVRFAAADIALHYPDPILIEPLGELLKEAAPVVRMAASSALEQIGGPEVVELAKVAVVKEKDEDVLEILEAILGR